MTKKALRAENKDGDAINDPCDGEERAEGEEQRSDLSLTIHGHPALSTTLFLSESGKSSIPSRWWLVANHGRVE